MKKQLEQAVKEIMEQYDRIDQIYNIRRGFNGRCDFNTHKNVKNEEYDDDHRCGRKTTH